MTSKTESTTTGVPAIVTAVAAVRKNLPALQKNGVGPSAQGSYKFLSIDDILTAVAPLEAEYGIISYPVSHSIEFHYNAGEMPKDGRVPRENVQAYVDYTFAYVSTVDGSEIFVNVPGEGIDSQDKATRKATTQAQKIANILLYNIITGEPDPDAQNGVADSHAETPTKRQVDRAKSATASASSGGTVTKQSVVKAQIQSEFVDNPESPVTLDTVKRIQSEVVTADPSAKGDALFGEILKRLKAGEV